MRSNVFKSPVRFELPFYFFKRYILLVQDNDPFEHSIVFHCTVLNIILSTLKAKTVQNVNQKYVQSEELS